VLRLAIVTIGALLGVVPAAQAVSVRAAPDGGRVLVTITGGAAAEAITVRPGRANPTVSDRDLEVELDVPRADFTQSGCREISVLAEFRRVRCRTGADGRVAAVLGQGDDTLRVEPMDRSLGGLGRVLDVDTGGGDDRVAVLTRLPEANQSFPGAVAPVSLRGGSGIDRLATESPAEIDGGADADRLQGGDAGDVLRGNVGEDRLFGGDGSDVLAGGPGGDDVEGGPGFDTHSYAGAPPVSVTLDDACDDGAAQDTRQATFVQVGEPGECQNNGVDRDRLLGIESVIGTSGADTLVGSEREERLLGGAGNDLVDGGGGRDDLIGEAGADTLLARDGVVDGRITCGDLQPVPVIGTDGSQSAPPPTPGDRAVADPADVVNASCAIVERGGATGPSEDAPPPTPAALAQPVGQPPPASGTSGTATPGAGPGGGLAGRPPQLRILTASATPDRRGRIVVRLACVYRARECASTVRLTAPRTLRAVTRRAGRRRVLRLPSGAVLGRARAVIPWGRSATVRITLSPAFRRFLAAGGRRRVVARLSVVARDGAQPASAAPARLSSPLRIGRR